MSTIVHVIYTGIISFAQLGSDGVWMLAPEAPGHKAYVIVQDAQVDLVELDKINPPGPVGMTAYALEEYEMSFTPGGTTDTSVVPACIVPLDEGCPSTVADCGKPHDVYHKGHDPDVEVRGRLRQGILEAIYVDQQWKWEFENAIGDPPKPVGHAAQEVCHRFEIAGTDLVVSFKDKMNVTRKLEMASRGGEPIELRIGNTLPNEIFIPVPGPVPSRDHHVAHYYEISHEVVPTSQRPWLDRLVATGTCTLSSSHGSHQLDGLSMAKRILQARGASSSEERASGQAALDIGPRRVGGTNCPPALWEP